MNVLDEFKNYKRKFIQISHRTAILMHIFEKSNDDFEDIILSDHEEYYKQNHNINIYKEAKDLDILMTHEASNLAEVGTTHDNGTKIQYCCAALTDEIRRKKQKYTLCGHVHTGNHNITACPVYDYVFQEETEWTNVRVANVSILDESYSIYFKPTTFEL